MEPSHHSSHHSGDLRPTSTGGAGAGGSDLEGAYGDPPNANSMPIGLTADDLQCPICVDTIHDAFVTTCGHTFCYQCITTHLKHRRNCPSCGNYLTTDHIYPNFLLSKVLVRAAATQAAETSSSLADLVQQALVGTDKKLHITDLDEVIGLLKGKRDQLARHEASSSLQLLLLFLKEAKQHKERELSVLGSQLRVLERDLNSVTHKTRQGGYLQPPQQQVPAGVGVAAQPQRHRRVQICTGAISPSGAGVAQAGGQGMQGSVATVKQEREEMGDEAAAVAAAAAPAPAPSVHVKLEEGGQCDEHTMLPSAGTLVGLGSQAAPPPAQPQPQSSPLAPPSAPVPQPGTTPPTVQPPEAGPSHTAGAAGGAAAGTAGSAAGVAAAAGQVPEIPAPRASSSAGHSLPILSSALQIADLAREIHGMGQEQVIGGVRKGGMDRHGSPLTATPPEELSALRAAKKRRIMTQFEQLQSCYLQLRAPGSTGEGQKPQGGQERQEQLSTMLQQLSPPAHALPPPPPPPPPQQQQQQQQQEAQPSCPTTCPAPHASSCTLTPELASPMEHAAALPAAAATAGGGVGQGSEDQQQPLKHPRLMQLGSTAGSSEPPCREGAEGAAEAGLAAHHRNDSSTNLQQFSQVLNTVTQHSRMSVQAEVPYAACGGWLRSSCANTVGVASYPQPNTAILDMEFDMEEELLATCAGQRVFLWDYEDVLSTTPDSLEPVCELCCRSKLASISCSRHERALLAAGDAEGRVYLWDVSTRQVVRSHAAHEKRVWALDFSPNGCSDQQPGSSSGGGHLLASGSDDRLLKVWSPKEQRPVATVDTGANVCSVRFNPWHEHLIAAGSAAHTALVFDLRMVRAGGAGMGGAAAATTMPLASFGGHRKAVAYVRWAGEDELLSASTDSMLRLWSLHGVTSKGGCTAAATAAAAAPLPAASAAETGMHAPMGGIGSSRAWAYGQGGEAVRTYSGHTNERNFVGLSQAGNYIATGSETGEVFIYLKHINTPSIRHRLSSSYPPANAHHAFHPHHRHNQQQPPPFISAVSWRQRSQTLMAANSQGHLWALALQP